MGEYQHYIRLNQAGTIVYGFSSAFEEPQEGDICINEDAGRHFQSVLTNGRGQFIYKMVNGAMIGRTQSELDTEWAARPVIPDPDAELTAAITNATTLEELKKALTGTNGRMAKVVGKMK